MKVYRLTVLVVDHDDIGAQEVKDVLENARYPNRCMSPEVLEIETREVEWTDEHPLNYRASRDAAARELFAADPASGGLR